MRIGVDGKKALGNFTGIGNYSRRVINGLLKIGDDVTVYGQRKHNRTAAAQISAAARIVTQPFSMPGKTGFELWRAFGLPRRLESDGVDLFHGLSNELPTNITSAVCKKVVTIHDLIFLRHPETYPAMMRRTLEAKTRKACIESDAIVAVSDWTRRDIVDLYGISPEKIHVIYQSIDPVYFNTVDDAEVDRIRNVYGISGRYVICVGTIEERKRACVAVDALHFLPDDVEAVIVGKRTPYQQKVEESASVFGNRVKILNGVPTQDLPALYAGASVALNPSKYEGFGIPVAEALAIGTPVIASKGSCLEEAGGPDSVYLEADSHSAEWASAIERILEDDGLSCRMSVSGREYAARFTDRIQAEQLHSLYMSLVK